MLIPFYNEKTRTQKGIKFLKSRIGKRGKETQLHSISFIKKRHANNLKSTDVVKVAK